MNQNQKWINAFWRWWQEAIDRKDYKRALELSDCIEKLKRR